MYEQNHYRLLTYLNLLASNPWYYNRVKLCGVFLDPSTSKTFVQFCKLHDSTHKPTPIYVLYGFCSLTICNKLSDIHHRQTKPTSASGPSPPKVVNNTCNLSSLHCSWWGDSYQMFTTAVLKSIDTPHPSPPPPLSLYTRYNKSLH